MPTCVVLGCGPSGLVAAHAASQMGYRIVILSQKDKSPIPGAQFLHAHIPGTNDPEPHWVQWTHAPGENGKYDPELYLRKVYGPAWNGNISPEMHSAGQQAWDLRAVYDELWRRFYLFVRPWSYSAAGLMKIIKDFPEHVFVNTIPRGRMCLNTEKHFFSSTSIYAMGDHPGRNVRCPYRPQPFTVEYNGNPNPRWYRASNIFSHVTMEWHDSPQPPPIKGIAKVRKPVGTNCDCWPEVHHTGRYGKWQTGFLLHHVYDDVQKYLKTGVQEALF